MITEEKYNSLEREYNRLKKQYDALKTKYDKTYTDMEEAERRIKYELEPRIKREQADYDAYVLAGGNSCTARNVNNCCNLNCEYFGEKDGCKELLANISDAELLAHYKEHDAWDGGSYIREELLKRNLSKEVREIDDAYCRKNIEKYEKNIKSDKEWIAIFKNFLKNGYEC